MAGQLQVKGLHARKNKYLGVFRVEKFEFGVQLFKKKWPSTIVGLP